MTPTPIKKSFQYGDHQVTIETGEIARQADAAVLVNMSDTVVLVTAVGRKQAAPNQNFLPLTVNYQEKTYAAGRIPGGFFKREGRPSEKETLTSRLIDRPIRPLFPKGFYNEVQIVATVISANPDVDPDIPSLIGASAALTLSGIPFSGPIGAARVGYLNGEYVEQWGQIMAAYTLAALPLYLPVHYAPVRAGRSLTPSSVDRPTERTRRTQAKSHGHPGRL